MVRTGRPPKPGMSAAEAAATAGLSLREAALAISRLRGAFEGSALSARERARRMVAVHWVRRQRAKSQGVPKVVGGEGAPEGQQVYQNSHGSAIRDPERHMEGA